MQIVVIGTGYVGLVTGVSLAEMGNRVTCLDIDEAKVAALNAGELPFYEPGLSEIVTRNRAAGRLTFSTDYASAIPSAQVCFLALPTPSSEEGACDISYVLSAAATIAPLIKDYMVIVVKSTVPVGTCDAVRAILQEHTSVACDVVSNPEFLREGCALMDCMKPDRIILGVSSERAGEIMKKIYAPFTHNHDRIQIMDPYSAELAKYAANAMLATRISFMNELSWLCEKLGANINDVRKAIGADHRIGFNYLYPGIGYGGSCLPKDVSALRATARASGVPTPLLDSVDAINQQQRVNFLGKILSYFESVADITLGIWGLSFKPDTDDLRESPALFLIDELSKRGATLRLFDPVAMEKAKRLLQDYTNITFCKDEYDAAEGADAVVLVTEWKQFRFVDFARLNQCMKGSALFDGRNQYSIADMQKRGFDYFPIGFPARTLVAR